MRSVPAGSFQRLTGFKALWRAWLACRRGKGRQPNIAAFDLDADRHLLRLHRELTAGAYRPRPYRVSIVRDPKTRLIAAPAIRDRVVQQALLAEIGPTYERGFISHWCGAFYLDGLDHRIKRELKARGYLRYMDDLALFADSEASLQSYRADIAAWLECERGLQLKEPEALILPNTQPATFLGLRVSRAGVLPGPKMKRRLQVRLAGADASGPDRLARGLIAYRGVLAPF